MKKWLFVFGMISILLFSCTDSLDFDQADDAEFLTQNKLSIVHFTLKGIDFTEYQDLEVVSAKDSTRFDVFEQEFVQKHLVKLDLQFTINNRFNYNTLVNIFFKNDAGERIYQVGPLLAPSGKEEMFIHTIEDEGIDALKDSREIVIELTSQKDSDDFTEDMFLHFESSGIFHLNIH
ncbi:hypothetical protein [Aureivirga sp. CE67]|uniref:hypothetical protein n=1 Tax=Aureivirga sp. CE67 TaxID=1788983 RepID=UPI0018CBEBA9|nr:hypothetical protein [Aureivirga sp. CE67]